MPAQYVIRMKSTGYADVLYQQVYSQSEIEARFRDLLKNGWSEADARKEVQVTPKEFVRCNEDAEGYLPAFCRQFVASYVEPGDVIVDDGMTFVVNRKTHE